MQLWKLEHSNFSGGIQLLYIHFLQHLTHHGIMGTIVHNGLIVAQYLLIKKQVWLTWMGVILQMERSRIRPSVRDHA